MEARICAPIGACRFMVSNSAAVRRPGLLRMCSGTAILPVSCSSAAASRAQRVLVGDPHSRASPRVPCWTRRTWRGVTSSRESIAVDKVCTVDTSTLSCAMCSSESIRVVSGERIIVLCVCLLPEHSSPYRAIDEPSGSDLKLGYKCLHLNDLCPYVADRSKH